MMTVTYTARKCIFTSMQRCSFTIPRVMLHRRRFDGQNSFVVSTIYYKRRKIKIKVLSIQYIIIITIIIIIRIRRGGAVSVKLQQLPKSVYSPSPTPPSYWKCLQRSFMRGGCGSGRLLSATATVLLKSGFYVIVSVFFWNKLDVRRFTRRFSVRGFRRVVTENGADAVWKRHRYT